jgi:GDP-mannose 6-dehydrogenase
MLKLKIAIIGVGYVGATCAACFSELGYEVKIFDKISKKPERLLSGAAGIEENGLSELIRNNLDRISSSSSLTGLEDCDVFFLCVDTPFIGTHLDVGSIKNVLNALITTFKQSIHTKEIVVRSTVQPGLLDTLRSEISNFDDYPVFLNPEFLREGSAISDFFDPPKIIIGENKIKSKMLKSIYETFEKPIVCSSFKTVEYTKLLDNSWHAVKVAFANEVGRILRKDNIDIDTAIDIFLSDRKLNVSDKYLRPGNAFGGSCLSKDLNALAAIGRFNQLETELLSSALVSNEAHIRLQVIDIVNSVEQQNLVLCNVAFKPGTNDLRETHVLKIGMQLRSLGKTILYCDENLTLETIGTAQVEIGNQIDKNFSQGFIDISQVKHIENVKIVRFTATGYQILDQI